MTVFFRTMSENTVMRPGEQSISLTILHALPREYLLIGEL
jgi:hypothetical protein